MARIGWKPVTRLLGALLITAFVLQAAGPRILIVTDMEGVGGVNNWDEQVMPGQRRFEETRRLLTGELNAAVAGAFDAGAKSVVVWDGHDGSRSLTIDEVDPRVELLQGLGTKGNYNFSRKLYDGVMFVGQHAMAGTKNGLLAHTQSRAIERITINGKPVGEVGQIAAIAGYFDIPVIFLSGDQPACDEIRTLQPTAEVAAVKRMVGRGLSLSLPHLRAKELIRAQARRAVERVGEFKPWKIDGPVEMRFEYLPSADPRKPAPATQSYKGATVLEAFEQWLGKAPTE
jgi:D-amino peptidase